MDVLYVVEGGRLLCATILNFHLLVRIIVVVGCVFLGSLHSTLSTIPNHHESADFSSLSEALLGVRRYTASISICGSRRRKVTVDGLIFRNTLYLLHLKRQLPLAGHLGRIRELHLSGLDGRQAIHNRRCSIDHLVLNVFLRRLINVLFRFICLLVRRKECKKAGITSAVAAYFINLNACHFLVGFINL